MDISTLIIGLIILGIVYWIVKQIPLPMPEWLLNVLFGVVAVLIILKAFGMGTGIDVHL